jgi:FG-GAP-like repeat
VKRRDVLKLPALLVPAMYAGKTAESLPSFVDVTAKAGLIHPVVYGGVDHKKYIIETNGCGVAFFDYDHDGWLDIFLPGGSRLDGPPPGATNRLYKNNRDGTFTDVTKKAGLERVAWVSGVCIGDYNNDGFDDLFLSCWGHNILYRNNGDGTFTDVTKQAGLLGPPRWGAGCTFIDYDRDGFLDLFVSTYLESPRIACGKASPLTVDPRAFRPAATSSTATIAMARSPTFPKHPASRNRTSATP